MVKRILWGIAIILAAALLQSTVLSRLTLYISAVPDLALCILVYISYVNGTMTGQLTGFLSGILLDFLSAAPLGLNAFVRTISGAVIGLFHGSFFLDIFFLPMALCAGATIIKAGLYFLLHIVFPDAVPSYDIFALTLWIEMGMNTFLAPFLFGLLKLIKPLRAGEREKAL